MRVCWLKFSLAHLSFLGWQAHASLITKDQQHRDKGLRLISILEICYSVHLFVWCFYSIQNSERNKFTKDESLKKGMLL